MNGKDCLLSCAGIVIFWGPLEERSSLRWSVRAGFGMAFLALRGFWGIWSETSEEFHHSHFVSCVFSHSVVSDFYVYLSIMKIIKLKGHMNILMRRVSDVVIQKK